MLSKRAETKAKEKQAIEEFRAMCEESVEPDSYSFLVDKIIPQLEMSRHLQLDYKIDPDFVDNFDGKWWLCDANGNKVRMLTDKESAEHIWSS